MPKSRIGRQTPTQSIVLPYKITRGQEAINLYNSTGRTAQAWQELLIYDMLAINKDKLWTHTKFGYSVPRRNGKNEILVIREIWGILNGERILHTAHRTTTSHAAWERICTLLDKAKIKYKSIKASGRESVTLKDGSGKIEFRTRSSKGGLGEGFDLLVIDEAQEYADDQESALKYVVTDSKNPQTIFCGTPPTPTSSGTVFFKLRNSTLQGQTQNTSWSEWSITDKADPKDKEKWYETNPSLGTILTERSVSDEIGTDDIDFNIQRLGLWLKYNQKSAISKLEWEALRCDTVPELKGKLFVGIKYGHDGDSVAMSIAAKTADGKIMIEGIDCRPLRAGTAWILQFLTKADIADVVIDGASGQQLLADAMKTKKLKAPILPTVKQIITANAAFEQGVYQKTMCHMGQPSMAQAASNCEKRAIGTNGGFGYRSLMDDIKIELLESISLAFWRCSEAKEKKKQKISY